MNDTTDDAEHNASLPVLLIVVAYAVAVTALFLAVEGALFVRDEVR